MRVFRICGCLLLLVLLPGILGCGSRAYVKKGPEVDAKTVNNTVTICNCKANPDTVKIPENQILTWVVDSHDVNTYSISFPKKSPFSSSTVPTGQGLKVKKDFWCKTLGAISTSLCVYPYNLIQYPKDTPPTTCHDPGVHVGS
jgi:hypothetical protein